MSEKININTGDGESANESLAPAKELANKLGSLANVATVKEAINPAEAETDPRYRFRLDKKDYPIFSRQRGEVTDPVTGASGEGVLSIDETAGLMVGRTAELIGVINGESDDIPKVDHVIYLDKSARPVSWLVDEFWDDFSDKAQPGKDFLAIDRRVWFQKVGIALTPRDEIKEPDGSLRVAKTDDFIKAYKNLPEETRKDWGARIRGLFIMGGIEGEDPDHIMKTPTTLDGKNLLIVDEVSRSGSTLGIAEFLMKEAIPKLKSVNGHVFWSDQSRVVNNGNNNDMQMGQAPVWYRHGGENDWIGRGVKDIDINYYLAAFVAQPNNITRAQKYGAFVLGVPMDAKALEEEPGQASLKLREEMAKMRRDYDNGRILPNLPTKVLLGEAFEKMQDKLIGLGVVFGNDDKSRKNPNNYLNLLKIRAEHNKPSR